MRGLRIVSTGRALPEHVVTNEDMSRQVDTSDEWIVSRSGIRERRFCTGEENSAALAAAAAAQAWSAPALTPASLRPVLWPL